MVCECDVVVVVRQVSVLVGAAFQKVCFCITHMHKEAVIALNTGTSAYGRPGGNSRDGRGGMAGGADAQQCPRLSLESVPISDHPNEAWLAAMRSATVREGV